MKRLICLVIAIFYSLELFSLGTLRVESIKELSETNMNIEVFDADGKFAPVFIVQTEMDVPILENISLEKEIEQIQSNYPEGSTEEMVFVQGGTFLMGSNEHYNVKFIHSVTVNDFYIGKYEVTQKEWKVVMGNNPSIWKGNDLPIEMVSWYDVVEFCNRKSDKEGLTRCYTGSGNNIICNFNANGYRLPTEAEWEYAARGGSKSKGYKYSGSNTVNEVAWYRSNSGNRTHQVGKKQENELGIYDMSGNVWELCYDWFDHDYYKKSPKNNPQGASSSKNRVARGGSWYTTYRTCLVANRARGKPDSRSYNIGFRLSRNPQ